MDQLSAGDRHQILRLESRMEEQPDAQAVDAWDGEWTYDELDQHSSALSQVLIRSGVMVGDFVALCFDKSKWTSVAVLGVLKAGGAFVFLDPRHPVERLRQMCRTVNAKLLLASLSQRHLAQRVCPDLTTQILNEGLLATTNLGETSLNVKVQPHHPAYAAFTSGSTGIPKGAVLRHDALVTSTQLSKEGHNLNRKSRILNFAAFAFDVNIYEHFWVLLLGGCLCIPSEDERLGDLERVIKQRRVNWAAITPTLARQLEPERLPSLKSLVLLGEPMTQKDIDIWSPHVKLINSYGPAECSIVVTTQTMGPSVGVGTIGRSDVVTCWVVDESDPQQLAPIGKAGELVLEGPAVSSGYMNSPEQTDRAFMTNPAWLPLSRYSSRKLYKTGDIVRYNPDGSLCILGRKDRQLKINGQRLEVSEIEHHLQKALNGGAQQAIVDVVTLPRRPKSLIVFIHISTSTCVTSSGFIQEPDKLFWKQVSHIRAHLLEHLPGYMVPELYYPVNSIPHTMTGKIDRKALREEIERLSNDEAGLYINPLEEDRVPEVPRTKEEKILQRLWSEALGIPQDEIYREDNWVRLGGDSVLAMNLVRSAREEGYAFSVANVMTERTIAALAQINRIADGRDVHADGETNSLKPFSLLTADNELLHGLIQIAADQCQVAPEVIEDIYPCTREHCTMIPREPGDVDFTLRVEASISPDLDLDRLSKAWSATVAANPMLRSRVVELLHGRFFYAVLQDSTQLEFKMTELDGLDRHEGRIWKPARPLVCIAVKDDRFVMLIHHLLYDGHSLPLIFRNIERAYQGQPLPVTPYRPFRGALAEAQDVKQQFWIERFKGWNGGLFPAVKEGTRSSKETKSLERQMPIYTTDYTASLTLHFALAVTISWYLNEAQDVVFGTTTSRRGASVPGVQGIIAPMFALLPMRVQLASSATIREHLKVLQKESLQAMEHELVDSGTFADLGGELATAMQYQTMLVVQPDTPADDMSLFHNIHMQYADGVAFPLNLGLQCFLSTHSVRLDMQINEPTTRDEIDWDRFADRFCTAFGTIQQQPDFELNRLFDRLATRSVCQNR
ncbi:hypothetical protein N7509_000263 [Penicillium cosmopolitanum]|uniref:Carrier domain-containing protein n=1 Tax=Penicillium cosmopolitanum TaxID=1131564 RepID=A0A9W9WAA6_9EURO|nr:uncharacterized protein N7509_000263 [Penicillium cosmopolitanum]KAJ5413636.1 hypothetical protein N7509_000263 [Penicillium cosmopolitanum]